MKKFIGIMAAVLLTAGLTACVPENIASEKTPVFSSVEEIYGMEAMTAVSLLGRSFEPVTADSYAPGGAASKDEDVESSSDKKPASEQIDLEKFNKYFGMLDSLMGEETLTTDLSDNTDENFPEYAKKLTVTGWDMGGESVVHVMYFNETEKPADDEPADGDSEQDEEEPETELSQEFVLEGVMVMGEQTYVLEGSRIAEQDEDETEQEITIRAYPDIAAKDTYVQVVQESETESGETEIQYVYSVYSAGELVEETSVEFEKEEKTKKTSAELTVEFLSGGSEGRYEIEKEIKNNLTQIKVEYEVGGVRGKFTIQQKPNGNDKVVNQYQFEDGSEAELEDDED